jgi:cytochrome c551/c552
MQSDSPATPKSRTSLIVIVALVLLVAISAGFIVLFISFQNTGSDSTSSPQEAEERAAALLATGDPGRGETLIVDYGCTTCHRASVLNQIAPSFSGVAVRAAEEVPALSAPAYLYQSLVSPAAHVVEGYNNIMPQDYGQRLSDQELGDILAYLMTTDAQ